MRGKITALQEALTGFFTDHHGFLLGKMLARVDAINADIAALDERIGQMIAPSPQRCSAGPRSRHQRDRRVRDRGRDRDLDCYGLNLRPT